MIDDFNVNVNIMKCGDISSGNEKKVQKCVFFKFNIVGIFIF